MERKFTRTVLISLGLAALGLLLLACGAPDRTGQGPSRALPTARILANQVGYEPSGTKRAVIQGHAGDTFASFTVKRYPAGEVVLTGTPAHVGPVARWKDWDFWTVDWSAADNEGTYVIECSSKAAGGNAQAALIRSHPLLVQKNALARNTLSDVIYYFKGQRSSGLWDKADRTMTFEGKPGSVDVHGGWFDATGDYGKHLSHLSYASFFNPQQISLTAWSLFRALEEVERRDESVFTQYRKRLLDEALFGADYLVRIKNPRGSFYITVSGRGPAKKPEDRRIMPKAGRHIILTPETKDGFRDYGRGEIVGDVAFEAGYREGAGLCIGALAMAAARGGSDGAPGSPGYGTGRGEGAFTAADYLKAAESAFAFLEANNLRFTNDGKENIVDDYCALIAATELYRTTGKGAYRRAADRHAASLRGRLARWSAGPNGPVYEDFWRADDADRPFFHPVDAGLPVVALLDYARTAEPEAGAKALEAVRRSLGFELAITGEVVNPFGYSRQLVQSKDGPSTRRSAFFFPHDTETAPWWQGENARLGSMAAAALLAARFFKEQDGGTPEEARARRTFAERVAGLGTAQLDWILGLNPYDACMLQGHGRNNIPYLFFESYEYTNAPGGICNGITGGYGDPKAEGIDFGLHFAETGKDDDWRWAEQWLPHAAWYLLAISVGK